MKIRKRILLVSLVVTALFATVQVVTAHPLGNFTINRYSRLELDDELVNLTYVVDMAEIPTFQERLHIDTNGDKQISSVERDRYLKQQAAALMGRLDLTVQDQRLPLELQSMELTFPPGQGDLPTLRLQLQLTAMLPRSEEAWQAHYRDENYDGRLGWQEIVVLVKDGVRLLDASVPAIDISDELRSYPDDLLQSPPAVSSAEFRFEPLAAVARSDAVTRPNESGVPAAVAAPDTQPLFVQESGRFGQDDFADILVTTLDQPGAILAALIVAAGLGAAHALTPGHGKTIVGAYLVGSRGTARHALFLGLTTTVTHTAGVFVFGLLVLFASQFILPEQLYPWLGVLSGMLVVLIGFSLFRDRWRKLRGARAHAEETGYHYHFGIGHSHLPSEDRNDANVSWRNLLALGVSGGLLPCPSALVLLLSAIALQRVGFGLILIVSFSLGLAGVLTGIGLTLVYAGRFFERLPVNSGRLGRALPVFSALFITIAGIGITVQAFLTMGV